MKNIVVSKLIISLLVLGTATYAVQAQKACASKPNTHLSRHGASEIIDSLSFKESDVVVVIADESSLAQTMYEQVSVKELTVAIADREACEDFDRIVSTDTQENRPRTHVVCGGLAEVDLLAANVVIVTALDVDLKNLMERATRLPDGVTLLTRDQLDFDQALHLEAIRTIATSPIQGITMYEYRVQRPTVSDLLTDLYTGMTGFGISQDEADVVRKAGGDPTYGEITCASAEKIFTELVPIGADDVFYDLGCGIGKLAMWVYLATPAKKSVGVELSDSRFSLAAKAKELMEKNILPQRKATMLADWGDKAKRKTVDFVLGNIADFDFRDATIIYMCATCYPDLLMQAMVDKFVTLRAGLRIVALKALPAHPSIHLVGTPQRFPMTWSPDRGSPVYIYEMRHPQLKDVLDKAYRQASTDGALPESEITYDSVKDLCDNILRLTAQDVFYVLGSGVGKLVLQAYLETPVKSVVGIEASQENFDVALAAYQRMKELLAESPYEALFAKKWSNADEKTLEFVHKNSEEVDLAQATKLVVSASWCSAESVGDLLKLCKKMPAGARVVALSKLSECPELEFVKEHKLVTSWSTPVNAYEYLVSRGVSKAKPAKGTSASPAAPKKKKA